MRTLALGLCLQLGIMGILTPYATGPSPVYYGSGYLPAADYWRLGAIFGVIFLAAFLAIGVPWMLLIRVSVAWYCRRLAEREEIMASNQFRIEHDFLGDREVPADAYYGIQTLRGKENFHITGMPISREPYFVKAFGYVKKAAAMANRDLGVLDAKIADAIIRACDRLIAGEMLDQFVTDFIQGGAGTSTNMNANEVIANLALEILGHKKGEYQYVNPNDHVNFGQSTNDVYPTAFHLGLILRLESYMEALRQLQEAFFAKAREFDKVLKMGRTHLQDAVPMSLGAEFNGWGTTIGEEVEHIADVQEDPAMYQPGRHRDRHDGNRRARLSRTRDKTPLRHHRHQVLSGRGPDRGDVGHGRLRATFRCAQAHLGQAHQDLQ